MSHRLAIIEQMFAKPAVRVVGLDPGLTRLGFGVVEEKDSSAFALDYGVLVTPADQDLPSRLSALFDGLTELLGRWSPDAVAVERVFLNRNARTATGSIQASGIALLAARRCDAETASYSPLEVKQAVVGTGAASKDQVRYMVERLLVGRPRPKLVDASDALAVALTHLALRKSRALEAAR